jgi:hypothetical protein
MPSTPLFSSYRTGENRVTGSMVAVFERLGLDVLERLLLGVAPGDDKLALVRFENQPRNTPESVPDASISGSFRLLFEVKTVRDTPTSGLGDQVRRHRDGLDGESTDERVYVITPDPEKPLPLAEFASPPVVWANFESLDEAIAELLRDADAPVSEQTAFLLRELRRLFDVEGLLGSHDSVIVAARRAHPAYLETRAYVCQPGRSFRKGLTYVGFYADREIKPILARVHGREESVLFTRENAQALRGDGQHRLAEVIERSLELEPDREDREWQVFLLSGPEDQETITLPSPIKNTTVVNGRPWAWTLGQRYARSDLLKNGYGTTSALDAAEGPRDAPMPQPNPTSPADEARIAEANRNSAAWARATSEVRAEFEKRGANLGAVTDNATVAEISGDGEIEFWDAVEARAEQILSEAAHP